MLVIEEAPAISPYLAFMFSEIWKKPPIHNVMSCGLMSVLIAMVQTWLSTVILPQYTLIKTGVWFYGQQDEIKINLVVCFMSGSEVSLTFIKKASTSILRIRGFRSSMSDVQIKSAV